jgi:hypothetical protein
MPKPACAKCQRFLRPLRNGVNVLETKPSNGARPGKIDEHLWDPYKVWRGDLWHCEGCGVEIISGWGAGPFMQDYLHSDASMREAADHTINDC